VASISQPVFIVGLPRSGTTWVGEVFSSDETSHYFFEPDNEKLSPLAWFCKSDLHRFPYLTAQHSSPTYSRLWNAIFGAGRAAQFANRVMGYMLKRNAAGVEAWIGNKCGLVYIDASMHRVGGRDIYPYSPQNHPFMKFFAGRLAHVKKRNFTRRRIIIKSVHAPLSVDWLSGNFPVRIVFVLRNPYSLYASYKRLRMPDGFRNLLMQAALQRDAGQYLPNAKQAFMSEREDAVVFQIMLMYKIIEKQIAMHPEWMLISHDRLCMMPNEGYRPAFDSLGLNWSENTDERIYSLNQTGGGFTPKRIASQQPSKWRSEMDASERAAVQRWIDYFELQDFLKTHITLD
jgi:hypothetical protein